MVSGQKEKLTIKHVAEAAGVARSSVSRAFTRPEMLSPETVRRVLDAAAKLGYVPNQTARALSTGRHGNVALIVPDIANPFFPPLIRAAQMEADRSDFCVFLGNSDEDPKQEDKLVGRFVGQVEGLVLASSRLSDERIRAHAAQRPLVLINRDVDGIPRVLIDSGSGVREAVAHLAELGHRHIVYVAGPATSWSNKQRRLAVRKSAERLRLKVDIVASVVPSYEAGREAVAAVIATGATAAIAFDDLTAQGILAGLADRRINVPSQFGVIGCDDVLGAATYPSLTTVSNRSVEAGKAALSLLVELLQSQSVRDIRYVLDTHLVVRNTTIGPTE
ncbi:LacI family DNA-binding transcriptional regulator [Microvirga lotononidis]|uniref:Transcriptional regulator n=1 Tax=Microvirga lotononidis TaxID=864069 RepID=I4Z2U6_9HYPH|nr:LacI family DNA-binding transcriptional regulator [Microvirga lotononidis]EIM30538.1 transcriptional regulator [Microvirga lotononidis]WQO26369.1 LacI family DNA-binding transcriptional regulator [Microvirga lotononidis]